MRRQHLPLNMLAVAISALLHMAAAAAILATHGGAPQVAMPTAMEVTLVFATEQSAPQAATAAEPAPRAREAAQAPAEPDADPTPATAPAVPAADLPAATETIVPPQPRAAETPTPEPRHKPASLLAANEPLPAKPPMEPPGPTAPAAAPAAADPGTAATSAAISAAAVADAHAASLQRFVAAAIGSNNPRPSYPPLARRRGLEGRVLLRTEVLPDGRSGRVSILSSSGSTLLDHAAEDAVRHWHFVPARAGDRPVPAELDVPVLFRLTD